MTSPQARVKGTRSPLPTVNSATVVIALPLRATGVESRAEFGPAMATIPSSFACTQGTAAP